MCCTVRLWWDLMAKTDVAAHRLPSRPPQVRYVLTQGKAFVTQLQHTCLRVTSVRRGTPVLRCRPCTETHASAGPCERVSGWGVARHEPGWAETPAHHVRPLPRRTDFLSRAISWRRTEYQLGFPGTHDASHDLNAAPSPYPRPPSAPGEATSSPSPAWDWLAAERIAVAVAGTASPDSFDYVHAILIHLFEKIPTSSALESALARGVTYERLWSDDRFLAAVWTIAMNKLTDERRAAVRRRSPRFRRPNGVHKPDAAALGWPRFPPYFRLVSAVTPALAGLDLPGAEVVDDSATPDAQVEAEEAATVSRHLVHEAMSQLHRADAVVIAFVYGTYTPDVHGRRVDEALAAHLSSLTHRPVTRDAARRRLTDARIRLEDAIVGAHRFALLDLVRGLPDASSYSNSGEGNSGLTDQSKPTTANSLAGHGSERVHAAPPDGAISLPMRTALVAYLSMVGRRPRTVVVAATYATVLAATPAGQLPWRDRRDFVGSIVTELRALFVLHQAHLGESSFMTDVEHA
jgi:DNA-directed RNA polymerase specialized sigma24 family protein